MEKKITQRIVGISVVIALIVILLPLLFGKNDAVTQTVSVKAPPFPDQQIEPTQAVTEQPAVVNPSTTTAPGSPTPTPAPVATSEVVPVGQPQQTATPAAPPSAATTTSSTADHASSVKSTDSTPTVLTGDAAMAANAITDAVTASMQQSGLKPQMDSPLVTAENGASDAVVMPEEDSKLSSQEKHTKSKRVKITTATHSKSVLVSNLKKVAWVVQIGSFKDKSNARRLADKLRAAGFKAFMREVKSAKGSAQTRVYIGPEYKQASAAKLSEKVEHELNLRGFIVLYKPLEL